MLVYPLLLVMHNEVAREEGSCPSRSVVVGLYDTPSFTSLPTTPHTP